MPPTPSKPGGVAQSASKKQRVSLARSRASQDQNPPLIPSTVESNDTSASDKFPYELMDLSGLSRYLNPAAKSMSMEQMVESLLASKTDRLTDKTLLLDNPVRAGSLSRQAGLNTTKRERFSLKLRKLDIVSKLRASADKLTFSQCLPLHELWKQQAGNKATAKQVGSIVTVKSCSIASLVGNRGIVLAETTSVLVIITETSNRLALLPRKRLSLKIEMPGGC